MQNHSTSVFDLAEYLLKNYKTKSGQKDLMTAMKLQKLVYYCQAWHMVWQGKPMFQEKIEAWIYGPVVPELFAPLKGRYGTGLKHLPKNTNRNPGSLNAKQKQTANEILRFYGPMSPGYLIGLTHSEYPWAKARKGLDAHTRGNQEIPLSDMRAYYSGLPNQNAI